MEWDRRRWNGMGVDGMEWEKMECIGSRWIGMGVDGIG
jgi:hypothetical protein